MDIPIRIPVDNDGFLRRECPTCEQEFKWLPPQEGDKTGGGVDHYYCPRCGAPAGPNSWWTPLQLKSARAQAAPDIERAVNDALGDIGRNSGGLLRLTPSADLNVEASEELDESNDMVIVEPPCHPDELLKVPQAATVEVHCLICGRAFAA